MNDTDGKYLRVVFRHVEGKWEGVWFKDLEIDDVFKMNEPDGTPAHEGQMWIVLDRPYFEDGTWAVLCETIIGMISNEA